MTEKLILAKVSEAGKIKNHSGYDFHVKKIITSPLKGLRELLLILCFDEYVSLYRH